MTAVATGSVTGHLDLLTALKTFLTTDATLVAAGEEWTVEKDETITSYDMTSPTVTSPTGGFGSTFRDVYFTGPGLAGTDAIHVNIRAYEAPNYGAYNWMIQGATDYDGDVLWHRQPNNSLYSNCFRYLTLSNSTIDYWFVANGRRFIVIVKISGDFYVSYCGFILPYALPSEYPYPLMVTGVTNGVSSQPSSTSMSNFWVSDYDNPAMFRHRDGFWLYSVLLSYITTTEVFGFWPWYPMRTMGSAYQHIAHVDGSFPLLPCTLVSGHDDGNAYGEADGVFFLPAFSPVISPLSEDTIQIGGVDYLVVQNVDKTGTYDYAAIRLD